MPYMLTSLAELGPVVQVALVSDFVTLAWLEQTRMDDVVQGGERQVMFVVVVVNLRKWGRPIEMRCVFALAPLRSP